MIKKLSGQNLGDTTNNERYICTNSLVWSPNRFSPEIIGNKNETPLLLDRTATPRGFTKAISLERTFDRYPWMYNRKNSSNFDNGIGSNIILDKQKSSVLKKKLRQARLSQS